MAAQAIQPTSFWETRTHGQQAMNLFLAVIGSFALVSVGLALGGVGAFKPILQAKYLSLFTLAGLTTVGLTYYALHTWKEKKHGNLTKAQIFFMATVAAAMVAFLVLGQKGISPFKNDLYNGVFNEFAPLTVFVSVFAISMIASALHLYNSLTFSRFPDLNKYREEPILSENYNELFQWQIANGVVKGPSMVLTTIHLVSPLIRKRIAGNLKQEQLQ